MTKALYDQFPIFSQFPERQFKKFTAGLKEKRFRPGEPIVRQGQTCPHAHFLTEGLAEVYSTSDQGDPAHILFYRAPALFGIIEIWNEAPYLGTVVALEPSTTLVMDKGQYLSLLHASHQACLTVIKFLSDQVYQGGVDQRVRLFGHTEHVIGNFLLRQAEACREKPHGGAYLPTSINKSRTARSLGVSRRHAIGCFKILEAKKLIEIQEGNVFIPSLSRLRTYTDSVWSRA